MARTVIEGQPMQLAPVTETNLRNAYLRYADLNGLVITDAYDADILDCRAQNVTLPEGGTDYIMSRRTDWTGSVMPSDLSSYSQLVVEQIRQALVTGRAAVSAQALHGYVAGSHLRSWQDSINFLINTGLSLEEVDDDLKAIFQGYPKLEGRLRHHIDTGKIRPSPPSIAMDLARFRVRLADGNREINLAPFFQGRSALDRYQTARDLEPFIESKVGEPVRCYVGMLDPLPIVFAVSLSWLVDPDQEDWWTVFWPS